MAKKYILAMAFLILISLAFSAEYSTYSYANFKGYASLLNGNPAIGINITLNCHIPNSTYNFSHPIQTGSNGFFSFEGINNTFQINEGDYLICNLSSNERGVYNSTNSLFNFTYPEIRHDVSESKALGIPSIINFTYNNTGFAYFNFSQVNGKLLSSDNEGLKSKNITLSCNDSFNYNATTNDYGFYSFSQIPENFLYSCNESETFGCYHSCSLSYSNLPAHNFSLNSQGFNGDEEQIIHEQNITNNINAKVNGTFNPNSGSYGNLTYFIYNASTYPNENEIHECRYSTDNNLDFPTMIQFNDSNLTSKIFIANITAFHGDYNYSVLCNTELVNETIPKTAQYSFNLQGANITINYPKNDSLFVLNSAFNITLQSPATYCNFTLNNGSYSNNMHKEDEFNFVYSIKNDSMLNNTGAGKIKENENNTVIFSCMSPYGILSFKSMNFTAIISPPPKIPQASSHSTNRGTAIISWTGVERAARYYIYRAQSIQGSLTFAMLANISASQTFYEDTTVRNHETYYYAVSPVDEYGNENSSYTYAGSGIKIMSEYEYIKEISQITNEINDLKNETLKQENELKEEIEIKAQLSIIENDLAFFEKFMPLLQFSQTETMNNIKSLMQNFESKSLNDLKISKYQVSHNLNTYFPDYEKSIKQIPKMIAFESLNISSMINESMLKIGDTNHYKYEVNGKIFNPSELMLKNIIVSIPIPQDAIIENELANNSIIYEIESLMPGEEYNFSYSFFSLGKYDFSAESMMSESIMPKSLTAYNVLKEADSNKTIWIIVWGMVFATSSLLLLKFKNPHINF